MADVNHSSLTDPKLHEPKGCSTANNGMVYVANGAGSGQWIYLPTGWGFYADDGSGQVVDTSDTKITCDGAASNSDSNYLPFQIRGSSELWDTATNFITPISQGDAYELRFQFPISAKSGSPNFIFFEFDIGGASSPSSVIIERTIAVPSSVPYSVSIGFPVFVSSDFKTNGGQIFLHTDTGTVTVLKPDILISRIHSGSL